MTFRQITPFLLAGLSLFFVSCVDSMQSVSYKNGIYEIHSRFTMSKEMVSTFVSLGDVNESDFDYDKNSDDYADILGNLLGDALSNTSPKLRREINDLYKELRDSGMFPKGGHTSKVDTNADVGIDYSASIARHDYNFNQFSAYIPKKHSSALTLELSPNLKDLMSNDSENLGEFSAFLSGLKHRIYIAKNLLPTLSKAELTNSSYIGKRLTAYDTGEMWCIEIPFSFLAEPGANLYTYVVMYF